MKTLLFLLLTLIHTHGFTLQPLEHLIPVSDFFHFYGQNDYMTDKNIGFDKENETIVLQFVELANHFSTTFIVEKNKSKVFRVIYVTKKHPNKNLSKRNIKVLTRNISKNSVQSLINTYQELLLETHYSKDTTNQLYMDGTTHQFYVSSNSYGGLFGETYSPQVNTDTYYLTESSKALTLYVQGQINQIELNNIQATNHLKLKDTEFTPDYNFSTIDKTNHYFGSFSSDKYLPCNKLPLVSLVVSASMDIQEIAMDKNIQESEVGGILMVWRFEACDLLEQGAHLYQETTQAIEKECTHIIELKGTNEKEYLADAKKHLTWYKDPSHVVIGWAEKVNNKKRPLHTIIASDGVETIKVKFPGYGYDTQESTQIECLKTPSSLFNF